MNQEIITKTENYVKDILKNDTSGHDWYHIYRVNNLAKNIASKEEANPYIVELGALLHDVADFKFHDGDEEIGPRLTREWLYSLNVKEEIVEHVAKIVSNISFKGANVKNKINTLEGFCVQDADRIDAIGAIGIARTFAYGGHKNREMYNPNIKPEKHETFEQYKNNKSPTINHFYEKLLLLKDKMHTKTGKEIAEDRHKFMELYLKKFLKEWEGKE